MATKTPGKPELARGTIARSAPLLTRARIDMEWKAGHMAKYFASENRARSCDGTMRIHGSTLFKSTHRDNDFT